MPTGYTADISKGISFDQFVMGCARGMGALIEMRDLPHDATIPERFEPSSYHLDRLKELKGRLSQVQELTPEEVNAGALIEYESKKTRRQEAIEKAKDLEKKYKEMLIKTRAWQPPSPKHERFKEFMLEQLRESIKFDCNVSYYEKDVPVLLTGEEWKNKELERLSKDIVYHTTNYAKEVERVEGRNEWLKQLRDSLK